MLESLLKKVAGLNVCNFIKKRLWHRCFPVKFATFQRISSFTEHLWWLLVNLYLNDCKNQIAILQQSGDLILNESD